MRIRAWSSDVCSSDLRLRRRRPQRRADGRTGRLNARLHVGIERGARPRSRLRRGHGIRVAGAADAARPAGQPALGQRREGPARPGRNLRSEEHTSELQSLMRISYAVFCLKKKKNKTTKQAKPQVPPNATPTR